ncbi:MAG: hypothetical protein FWG92_02250 [Leptospirales bacterium]|nr:hypothetical protein [Leptospirales bacterium]
MNKLIIAVFAALLLSLAGCSTTPICLTSAITPLDGKNIDANLGKAKGSDTAYSVLGLFMIGRPDIGTAVNNALTSSGGDTLINVRCYQTYYYFFFWSSSTVVVQGDAVKLSDKGRGR